MEDKDFKNLVIEQLLNINSSMNSRFDNLEGRFDYLEGRFDTLEGRFDTLEVRFDKLSDEHELLAQRLQKELVITIENTIAPAIKFLAEGYESNEQRILQLEKKIQ